MKGVYVFLADGFEEIEALATIDILRRGGVGLKTVSVSNKMQVTGSHGVLVVPDILKDSLNSVSHEGTDSQDVMIFPGGMPGSKTLGEDEALVEMMRAHYAQGGTVAAICAAPGLVLSRLSDIKGKKMTCYDGFDKVLSEKGADYVKTPAVRDGNIITGRGPGFAFDFALEILRYVKGEEAVAQVKAGMLI